MRIRQTTTPRGNTYHWADCERCSWHGADQTDPREALEDGRVHSSHHDLVDAGRAAGGPVTVRA